MRIVVYFKDGTEKIFPETQLNGGSYHTSFSTREGWLIIEDAYGARTIYPSDVVKEVKTDSYRRASW